MGESVGPEYDDELNTFISSLLSQILSGEMVESITMSVFAKHLHISAIYLSTCRLYLHFYIHIHISIYYKYRYFYLYLHTNRYMTKTTNAL